MAGDFRARDFEDREGDICEVQILGRSGRMEIVQIQTRMKSVIQWRWIPELEIWKSPGEKFMSFKFWDNEGEWKSPKFKLK